MSKNKFIIIFVLPLLFLFGWKVYSQEIDNQYQSDRVTQKIIDASLHKKNDLFEILSLRVFTGEYKYFSNFEQWKGNRYNGRVISFKNESLGYFPVDNGLVVRKCSDGIDEKGNMIGGCKEQPEGDLIVQMPYFSNGKYADIYDLYGKKVLTIDLSSKATCNENGQCDQPIEDSENCPQDCTGGEPKLDPVVVAEAQRQSAAENGSSASNKWIFIAAGIVLALAGLGFWLWKRYQKYKEQI